MLPLKQWRPCRGIWDVIRFIACKHEMKDNPIKEDAVVPQVH